MERKSFLRKIGNKQQCEELPGAELVGWHHLGIPGINSEQLLKMKEDFFLGVKQEGRNKAECLQA